MLAKDEKATIQFKRQGCSHNLAYLESYILTVRLAQVTGSMDGPIHQVRIGSGQLRVHRNCLIPAQKIRALLQPMQDSDAADGLIALAASRFLGKAGREAASVLSSAQCHTLFLDSPQIAKCLMCSDFAFADLRHRLTSVFLVLPPNRMDAYKRWLRLLVSQALQDIARDAEPLTATTGALGAPQRF